MGGRTERRGRKRRKGEGEGEGEGRKGREEGCVMALGGWMDAPGSRIANMSDKTRRLLRLSSTRAYRQFHHCRNRTSENNVPRSQNRPTGVTHNV